MQTGDIIAVYNTNPLNIAAVSIAWYSNPILFFIKGFWNIPNHIAIYTQGGTVVEALPEGVQENKTSKYKNDKIKIYRLKNISRTEQAKINRYVKGKVGKKYDFFAFLGFILFPVIRLFGVKNPFQSANDLYCSELFVQALHSASTRRF